MMRPTSTLLAAAMAATTLAACSRQETDYPDNQSATEDAAPDIALTAAPNVAFSYAYRFALAAGDIAAVQEKHAAACEALGLERCRITGVRYQRSGTDRAYGDLVLALAPDVACKFGKDATAAVEAARGTLSDVQIGGEDHSRVIQSSDEALASAQAERARLEKALSDRQTPAALAVQLRQQIAAQREVEREAGREGRDARALVALTPMRFSYSTHGYMPGLSIERTTKAALAFASMLLNAMVAILVVLLTLAVPAGLALLGLAHGRRFAARLWERFAPRPAAYGD